MMIKTSKPVNNKAAGFTFVKKETAGFTLIELVVVVAILLVTVGIAGDIIISLTRTFGKTQVSNDIETTSNFVLIKLEKEFRSATSVVTPAAVGASGNTLHFINKNGKRVCYVVTAAGLLNRSFDTVNCASQAPLTANDSATGVLVTGTPAFTLTSDKPYVIKINMTFSSATPNPSTTFSGTVTLNNTLVARGSY